MKTPFAVTLVLASQAVLMAADKAEPPRDALNDVRAALDEVGVPPPNPSAGDPFRLDKVAPEKMAAYPADAGASDLRTAVRKTHALLWAASTDATPPAIADEVAAARKGLKGNLRALKCGYRKPDDENRFRDRVFRDEKDVAEDISVLQDALDELRKAGEGRAKETKRWQANYDYTLARLEEQVVFLIEYQSMLGLMRKELPPLAAGQNAWKLAPRDALQGDPEGKRLAREARKLLEKVVADNPGTPWEALAERDRQAPLGLEWQGFKDE